MRNGKGEREELLHKIGLVPGKNVYDMTKTDSPAEGLLILL